jgi:hypothetical protein
MPTDIYFGANAAKLSIRVEEDFVTATHRLQKDNWVEFSTKGGKVVVNAPNVLWVQEARERSGRMVSY